MDLKIVYLDMQQSEICGQSVFFFFLSFYLKIQDFFRSFFKSFNSVHFCLTILFFRNEEKKKGVIVGQDISYFTGNKVQNSW